MDPATMAVNCHTPNLSCLLVGASLGEASITVRKEHWTHPEDPTSVLWFWRTKSCVCCCSVPKSCLTLCNPRDCSLPGFPVLHHLPELAQTHVHQVSAAIQPSYPLSFFSFCLQSFPESGSFPMSWLFTSGGQRTGASASASVLSVNIQGWLPLRSTGWISLLSKGLWRVFSSTTNRSINFSVLGLLRGPTLTFVHNYWKKTIALTIRIFVGKVVSLLLIMLSKFVIAFLPRSKCLLISWLRSLFAVILEPKKMKSATVSTFCPSICHEVMGLDAMILVLWMLSFKPAFALSSFTFIKKFFIFSSLSIIRVVSCVFLRLLIFLLTITIPAWDSCSLAFCMMYSAYTLNKQDDNIQTWHIPFPILNQSVLPCPVLIIVSWPEYRFLRKQAK